MLETINCENLVLKDNFSKNNEAESESEILEVVEISTHTKEMFVEKKCYSCNAIDNA
jgi:hypothetical protein